MYTVHCMHRSYSNSWHSACKMGGRAGNNEDEEKEKQKTSANKNMGEHDKKSKNLRDRLKCRFALNLRRVHFVCSRNTYASFNVRYGRLHAIIQARNTSGSAVRVVVWCRYMSQVKLINLITAISPMIWFWLRRPSFTLITQIHRLLLLFLPFHLHCVVAHAYAKCNFH